MDVVSWHTDHTLNEMLRWVDRVMKNHDVAAPNLAVGHERIPNLPATIAQFVYQQVITDEKGVLHRLGRNLESLHRKRDHKHRDHNRRQQGLNCRDPIALPMSKMRS